jgi:hypothetical protein
MALLTSIMLIIAGLILLTGVLRAIPALGEHLEKMAVWLGSFQVIIGIIAIIVGVLDLGLGGLFLILSGFILAAGIMGAIPALGEHLEKISKALAGIQVPIGVVALVLGIWLLL